MKPARYGSGAVRVALTPALEDTTISRTGRILAVTATLAGIGAAVGALLGMVAIAFVGFLREGPTGALESQKLFPVAAFMGGSVGVLLGPLSAWTLMRHVPIWKAIVGTAVGTAMGFVVGSWLGRVFHVTLDWALYGSVLGFLLAAVILRFRSPRAAAKVDAVVG